MHYDYDYDNDKKQDTMSLLKRVKNSTSIIRMDTNFSCIFTFLENLFFLGLNEYHNEKNFDKSARVQRFRLFFNSELNHEILVIRPRQ